MVDAQGRVFVGPTPEELRLRRQLLQSATQLDLRPPERGPFSFQVGQLDRPGTSPQGRARPRSRSPRPRSPRRAPSPRRRSPSPRRRPSPRRHSPARFYQPGPPFPLEERLPFDRRPAYPRYPSPGLRRGSPGPLYPPRYRRHSPLPAQPTQDLASVQAAAGAAAAEAIQAALQPIQQSFAALQQREQERSLPAVRKPAFAAVLASLQLLPGPVQNSLQPFYLALRAADSVDSDEQAATLLEPLVRFCVDHPGATAADLRQQVQLQSAGAQLNPLLGLLSGNGSLLSLLSGQQAASSVHTVSPATSCFKCGLTGHLASSCNRTVDKDGKPVAAGQLKFAPASWKSTYHFGPDGFKQK